MRKFRLPAILLFGILFLLVLKIFLFPGSLTTDEKLKTPATKKISLPLVYAKILVPEVLENTIHTSGSLKANEEVEIQPEVSGKITEILFQEGSKVSKGQLLFRLNDLDLEATLKKLRFNLDLAKENEKRQSALLRINGISQQDYDTAKNLVESTEADIEFTKVELSKTKVLSPFDGFIGLRYVSTGSYVSQSTKIATIQQINPLKLDFSIPEQYANAVKIGDKIDFTVQGDSSILQASIHAIEPRIDISTRTLSIRALYQNMIPQNNYNIKKNRNQRILLPGTFASVSLNLHTNNKALMVPTESLVPILKGQTLFVYHGGKVEQVSVQTGIRTDIKVEITSGVAAGDTIITSGLLSLKPNQEIRLIKIS